jgi:mycofactocin precursor
MSSPSERKFQMDHENETETELVTEILVEEVSIDGMCGVY